MARTSALLCTFDSYLIVGQVNVGTICVEVRSSNDNQGFIGKASCLTSQYPADDTPRSWKIVIVRGACSPEVMRLGHTMNTKTSKVS